MLTKNEQQKLCNLIKSEKSADFSGKQAYISGKNGSEIVRLGYF